MLALLIIAYILGAIPFGKLFCQLGGSDIQKRGSGNIGYANVLRIMGWKYAIPTLVCDILKGFAPTYVAYQTLGPEPAFAVGCAAIIGHVYPIWLKFRGGKGVATGLGVLLVYAPLPAIIGTAAYFSLTHAIRSQSSFASIISASIAIGGFVALSPNSWWMGVILLGMALFTLRQNLFGRVPDYG